MPELRRVDPATLAANPDNPRRGAATPAQDAQLVASIRIVGLIQPPRVTERDGSFIIVAGHRRVRAAIAAGLDAIDVLVGEPEAETDAMRSVAENVVRAALSSVDIWRAIAALEARGWTEAAIADALALPPRTVRRLKLLAKVHPPMLEAMNNSSMPNEEQLRTIAAAAPDEQAQVWKKHRPRKGETTAWWEVARALAKRRIPAAAAKFDDDIARQFGVVWTEDLFAPADEDGRYTTNVEGFFAAQQHWLQENLPTGGTLVPVDQYGQPALPKSAERVHGKPAKGDKLGHYLDGHSGEVRTVTYRLPAPKKPAKGEGYADTEAAETADTRKPRPDVTEKGRALIGTLRTEALHATLHDAPFDDTTLLGLLVLALAANNVAVMAPGGVGRFERTTAAGTLIQGGALTADAAAVRAAARTVLAATFSCQQDATNSGVVARVAGEAIGAAHRLPHMATEEFLTCLSKPALERAATASRVAPRPTAKATRAALIAELSGGTWVHPEALFRLSAAELAELRRVTSDEALAAEEDADSDDDEDANEAGHDGTTVGGDDHDAGFTERSQTDADPAAPLAAAAE